MENNNTELNNTQGLVEKLLSSYKQAAQYIFTFIGYAFIALIVIAVGITEALDGGALGTIIVFIGAVLLVMSGFSALLYASSRGGLIKDTIGFLEAYQITFKLTYELGASLLIALLFILIGNAAGGGFGALLLFIGGLTFVLFPIAGRFFVLNYIVSRK